MYIKGIRVQNFRQLKDVTLDLQKNTTILAGPNNSGKTSCILLLKRMLLEKNFEFSKDDFNAYDKHIWSNSIYKILQTIYNNRKNKREEELIQEFADNMFPIDNKLHGTVLPKLIVQLQVDYSADDDISNFADYIMDLDCSHNSFYFLYKIILNRNSFIKGIKENWTKIYNRLKQDKDKYNNKKQSIIDIILNVYCDNLTSECYFTDENYKLPSKIENIQDFKRLFNFKYIEAARPLNDSLEKDKHLLSNTLITLASKDTDWQKKINKLPDKILNALDKSRIKSIVEKISTSTLNNTIKSISQTNGGHTGNLSLNLDVSEKHIQDLIRNTMNARYSIAGKIIEPSYYNLSETSQGLGYSNLIYIHTQIEDYIKSKDILKINFLIIEEPESHMHPQMQYVFSNELLKQYDKEDLQGLITTHSSEIVRGTGIERLRVIREETLFNSTIYNLSSFINNVKTSEDADENDVTLIKDYKTFYEDIGISEIIFADAAILFEGDTERLYLKKLLTFPDFKSLQQKYIAYIQVGGAYAYNFKPILEYLKIKSLIITDIDYGKNAFDKETILSETTTNSTIKNFYEINHFNEDNPRPEDFKLTIQELYNWIDTTKHIVAKTSIKAINQSKVEKDLMYLAFQTESDGYTRTLEAAMLSKKFHLCGYDRIGRNDWIKKKADSKLIYSIPNNKKDNSNFNLIDILNSTSESKTDFMYSVILNGYSQEMLPDYIKEGLKWLME